MVFCRSPHSTHVTQFRVAREYTWRAACLQSSRPRFYCSMFITDKDLWRSIHFVRETWFLNLINELTHKWFFNIILIPNPTKQNLHQHNTLLLLTLSKISFYAWSKFGCVLKNRRDGMGVCKQQQDAWGMVIVEGKLGQNIFFPILSKY